jgi:hypothetical protein
LRRFCTNDGGQRHQPDEVVNASARCERAAEKGPRGNAVNAIALANPLDAAEQVLKRKAPDNRAERREVPDRRIVTPPMSRAISTVSAMPAMRPSHGEMRGQAGGPKSADADEHGLPKIRHPADAGQQNETDGDDRMKADIAVSLSRVIQDWDKWMGCGSAGSAKTAAARYRHLNDEAGRAERQRLKANCSLAAWQASARLTKRTRLAE